MGECDRRASLRMFGAGTVLFLAGMALSEPLRAATTSRVVPSGLFRLSRLVERELFDNELLSVERSWTCRFSDLGRGMVVDGASLDCVVLAPEKLAALARMEKERTDTGPFPAILDAGGHIASADGEALVDTARLVDSAMSVLENIDGPAADNASMRRVLSQLAAAAQKSLTAVPADLFFPNAGTEKLSREVAIAPDSIGRIDVETASTAMPDTGLLIMRERRIQTSVGGHNRLAREVWKLTPL